MSRALIAALTAAGISVGLLTGAPDLSASAAQPPPDTQVEGVTVTGALAPVPKVGVGAPMFTPEELVAAQKTAEKARSENKNASDALRNCSEADPAFNSTLRANMKPYQDGYAAASAAVESAQAARLATLESLALRRLPLGQATVQELEAAELKRQAAVNRMVAAQAGIESAKASAIFVHELGQDGVPSEVLEDRLEMEETKRGKTAATMAASAIPARYADLTVEKVVARVLTDRKGAFLRVTGAVRNTRDRKISQPFLSFTALDAQGLPLLKQVAHGRGSIAPGKSSPFAFDLRPKPDLAKTVEVTFADREPPRLLFAPPTCFRLPMPPSRMVAPSG